MAVNDGDKTEIKFSEIQKFYGGEKPISLSEYYRGGKYVSVDFISAQEAATGSSNATVGQFSVSVTTAYTGAVYSSGAGGSDYTVTAADDSFQIWALTADADGGLGRASVEYRVNRGSGWSGWITANVEDGTGNGGVGWIHLAYGPANTSGYAHELRYSVGTRIQTQNASYQNSGGVSVRRKHPRYTVTFTNNSGQTLTTLSNSTGGTQSYTANQTRTVINSGGSPHWTLGYNAIAGNTNVPYEKTVPENADPETIDNNPINMNVFNVPGIPSP